MNIRLIRIVIGVLLSLPLLAMAQLPESPAERETEIRQAVTDYVQHKTAKLGYDVRIKRFAISGKVTLPEGPLDYEVLAPQQWEGWGGANITVIARKNGRVVKNIPLRVEVEALADMVMAVRKIEHGSVINVDDLAVQKFDLALAQGRHLSKIADVAGKKARTTLRQNAPVRSDQLEKIPLIKVGQIVTIVAENEHMRVTVTGKAKSAGAVGDTIMVQNLSSLKDVPARVLDAGTVLIVF